MKTDVKKRAAAKNKDLSASLEDYLEAIFNLSQGSSVARSRDIAKSLGVSRASVTAALRSLKQKGLANYKPYNYVTLTGAGRGEAAKVVRRHNILQSFFEDVLGIKTETAQEAACKAEHILTAPVIERLLYFIEFATKNNKTGCDLAGEFERFCDNKLKGNSKTKRRTGK